MNKPVTLSYLETAHRNVAWFIDRHRNQELDMRPPFQRNPVWTTSQKSFLVDTVLRGLPVPELYMQDIVDEEGKQQYVLVDGQQRIRACLEYVEGRFALDAADSPEWGNVTFEELTSADKKAFFAYKFVVRTLPDLPEPALRDIFQRLNRNVVALNAQELRHATYWGPFIKTIEAEAEENEFWSEAGIFTAAEFRRMSDAEFISELVVAYLHGVQEKKKRLDEFYQLYEEGFEDRERVRSVFRSTTSEIAGILPDLRETRWRKKSDFYTLFLVLATRSAEFPLTREGRERLRASLRAFAHEVDDFLRIDDEAKQEGAPVHVARYGKAVSRAASDLQSRKARHEVLAELVTQSLASANAAVKA
jgi:hypothetical protein